MSYLHRTNAMPFVLKQEHITPKSDGGLAIDYEINGNNSEWPEDGSVYNILSVEVLS